MGLFDKIKNLLGGKKPEAEPSGFTSIGDDPVEQKKEWIVADESVSVYGDYFSLACSHVGYSHTKKNTPCQDYASHVETPDYRIITVSDGHGSSNFTRSDRGSRFACQAAEEALREFAEKSDPAELAGERRRYEAQLMLCKNILLRWHAAVEEDHATHPFTEEEVAEVSDKYKSAYLAGTQIEHAYGATIIAVLITKDYMLAIRNGDGECVVVDRKGKLSTPIPWNEKCEASTVTSLCDKNAIVDFRFHYTTELPAAVFIGSDGIDNSYPKTEDLYALYCNICTEAVANGIETAEKDIADFLPVLTEKGSQDDVSIAAVLDRVLLPRVNDRLLAFVDHQKRRREAEDTRRKLAKVTRNLKDKQKALEIARQRADENKNELEDLTIQKWSIPGLELSADEMDGLRQGVHEFEEKIVLLTGELELLEAEKHGLALKLADLVESLAADEAATKAEEEAEQKDKTAADTAPEVWTNGDIPESV